METVKDTPRLKSRSKYNVFRPRDYLRVRFVCVGGSYNVTLASIYRMVCTCIYFFQFISFCYGSSVAAQRKDLSCVMEGDSFEIV